MGSEEELRKLKKNLDKLWSERSSLQRKVSTTDEEESEKQSRIAELDELLAQTEQEIGNLGVEMRQPSTMERLFPTGYAAGRAVKSGKDRVARAGSRALELVQNPREIARAAGNAAVDFASTDVSTAANAIGRGAIGVAVGVATLAGAWISSTVMIWLGIFFYFLDILAYLSYIDGNYLYQLHILYAVLLCFFLFGFRALALAVAIWFLPFMQAPLLIKVSAIIFVYAFYYWFLLSRMGTVPFNSADFLLLYFFLFLELGLLANMATYVSSMISYGGIIGTVGTFLDSLLSTSLMQIFFVRWAWPYWLIYALILDERQEHPSHFAQLLWILLITSWFLVLIGPTVFGSYDNTYKVSIAEQKGTYMIKERIASGPLGRLFGKEAQCRLRYGSYTKWLFNPETIVGGDAQSVETCINPPEKSEVELRGTPDPDTEEGLRIIVQKPRGFGTDGRLEYFNVEGIDVPFRAEIRTQLRDVIFGDLQQNDAKVSCNFIGPGSRVYLGVVRGDPIAEQLLYSYEEEGYAALLFSCVPNNNEILPFGDYRVEFSFLLTGLSTSADLSLYYIGEKRINPLLASMKRSDDTQEYRAAISRAFPDYAYKFNQMMGSSREVVSKLPFFDPVAVIVDDLDPNTMPLKGAKVNGLFSLVVGIQNKGIEKDSGLEEVRGIIERIGPIALVIPRGLIPISGECEDFKLSSSLAIPHTPAEQVLVYKPKNEDVAKSFHTLKDSKGARVARCNTIVGTDFLSSPLEPNEKSIRAYLTEYQYRVTAQVPFSLLKPPEGGVGNLPSAASSAPLSLVRLDEKELIFKYSIADSLSQAVPEIVVSIDSTKVSSVREGATAQTGSVRVSISNLAAGSHTLKAEFLRDGKLFATSQLPFTKVKPAGEDQNPTDAAVQEQALTFSSDGRTAVSEPTQSTPSEPAAG